MRIENLLLLGAQIITRFEPDYSWVRTKVMLYGEIIATVGPYLFWFCKTAAKT